MNFILNKVNIGIMLMMSVMLFGACSDTGENNQESTNNQPTDSEQTIANDDEQAITDDTKGAAESVSSSDFDTGENNIPTSEFIVTQMSIGSFLLTTSMDINSNVEKEVMDTLSEFNAVTTDEGAKLTLPDNILFDYDSADLRSEADKVIDQLVQAIEATEDGATIVGHTDSKGDDSYNQTLSEERAEAVRQALIDSGIDEDRLNAEGMGATEPVAKNTNSDGSDNPEGRQKNRRVEVTIHGFN